MDGSTVVVGARGVDGVSGGQGSAYLFDVSGNQLTQLTPRVYGESGIRFGFSVAISGSCDPAAYLECTDGGECKSTRALDLQTIDTCTVVVGARNTDHMECGDGCAVPSIRGDTRGGPREGRCYSSDWLRSGLGQQRCPDADAWVGATNPVAGPIIGYAGSAYVFDVIYQRSESHRATQEPWYQLATLTASDGEGWDYFGASVAISGSTVVGGIGSGDGGTGFGGDLEYRSSNAGSAYLFSTAYCGDAEWCLGQPQLCRVRCGDDAVAGACGTTCDGRWIDGNLYTDTRFTNHVGSCNCRCNSPQCAPTWGNFIPNYNNTPAGAAAF